LSSKRMPSGRRGRTKDWISIAFYEYLDKWAERLGLQNWTMEVRFKGCEDPEAFAEVDCRDPEYEAAYFTVAPRRMRSAGFTRDNVETIVLHELVHMKIALVAVHLPETKAGVVLEELLVSGLVDAFLRTEEEGS